MAELGETLSARELDVLGCIVNGASNKEVAAELHISQNTVKVHLRNIYTKLGASSRTEAVTIALQQGIASIPGGNTEAESSEIGEPLPVQDTAVSDSAVEPTITTTPEPKPSRNWFLYSTIGIVTMILLGMAAYIGYQSINPTGASNGASIAVTPELYPEEAISQTRWLTSRPLTMPLANMATASVGIDIYHIGGETESGITNLVNRFDTATRTWHQMASKPTAVTDTTAAVLFGEIYVPGGLVAEDTPTNIVEAFSPANNAWRSIANLPTAISGGLALSNGSFLYLIGGWDGNNYLDTVYVYDAGNDSWRPLTNLPTPLAAATGGIIAGELYVIGGTDGQQALDACHIYNIDTDTWQECPAMLAPRNDAGTAVILNKLYVIGGDDVGEAAYSFSEFYDPNSQTWQVINVPMLEDAKSWKNLGVTHVESKIYTFGGKIGGNLSDGNFVYSPLVYQTFIPAASGGGETTP